jgi:hypothetical protein
MRTTASALSLTGRKRLRHRMRVHAFIGAIRRQKCGAQFCDAVDLLRPPKIWSIYSMTDASRT